MSDGQGTLPPSYAEAAALEQFERQVRTVGEHDARLGRLAALLAPSVDDDELDFAQAAE